MKINKILNIMIVIIAVIIVFVLIYIFKPKTPNNNQFATLRLYGTMEVTLYKGDKYEESGYLIVKSPNDNSNYRVNVINNLNINVIGEYSIKYQLFNDQKIIEEKIRKVNVIEKPVKDISISLKGNDTIYQWLNEPYLDEGAKATSDGIDISNQIKTEGNVNVNKAGIYEIKYSINVGGIEKTVKRTVNIIELKVNENVNYNKSQIELVFNIDNFSYVTLPNGNVSYNAVFNYPITANGSYSFVVYTKTGLSKRHTVNVTSIVTDKKGPTGSCVATISGNTTKVNVSASDESGIARYVYNNNSYPSGNFTLTGEFSNVIVTVYDKFNNYTNISCYVKRAFDNNMNNITLSSTLTPCNSDWTIYNNELKSAINQIGYKTRDAVAYAATYLAGFKYKVAYSWGGKTLDIGLNPRWGCDVEVTKETCTKVTGNNRCIYGMDCTGYTAWAFAQAGFDRSILRTSSQSTGMWGNFNASKHKYSFRGNQDKVHLIKPGDIVHTEGHVGIVIGTSDTQLKVANMVEGVKITYLNKTNGKSVNGQNSFDNFVLFDDFFTMYGN